MSIRSLPTALALALLAVVPAGAQPRTDILTGEPIRPGPDRSRREPDILNAPHAPRQDPGRGDPRMDMYVTPQYGTGNGYSGNHQQQRQLQPRQRYDTFTPSVPRSPPQYGMEPPIRR